MTDRRFQRKRLILFVGHHKVGSTSLQDYLARNAPNLARHGILYPFVDFQGMAYVSNELRKGPVARAKRGIACALGRSWVGHQLPINVREPHNALAFRMMNADAPESIPRYHKKLPTLEQMEHAIRQQIAFSNPHTVIVASEVMANFALVCPDNIGRLLQLFPDYDVTFMATLRRVDEYLMSWHGQRLKFGHHVQSLSGGGFKTFQGSIHFDYRKMLEKWLAAVPHAKIVIRDYHDVVAGGGSVRDFVHHAELKLPWLMQPARRQNDGMHRGLFDIVRRGNLALPRPSAGVFRTTLRGLSKGMTLPKSNTIELLGADARQHMAEAFAPIDGWLGEVTGQSGGFFAHQDRVLAVKPVPEADVIPEALEQAIQTWPTQGNAADLKPFLMSLKG